MQSKCWSKKRRGASHRALQRSWYINWEVRISKWMKENFAYRYLLHISYRIIPSFLPSLQCCPTKLQSRWVNIGVQTDWTLSERVREFSILGGNRELAGETSEQVLRFASVLHDYTLTGAHLWFALIYILSYNHREGPVSNCYALPLSCTIAQLNTYTLIGISNIIASLMVGTVRNWCRLYFWQFALHLYIFRCAGWHSW